MSKVKKSVVVDAPVDIVYDIWHNFENFPNFMGNIEEVRVVGGGRSHWKAKGPLGASAEWDAEITLDQPNESIGWRSIEGDRNVKTAGRVNFHDAAGATELDVTIEYDAPGGLVGETVTKIFSNPEQQVEQDLARFKEMVEADAHLASIGHRAMQESTPLGSSMGAMTEEGLEEIDEESTGASPAGVDDPATRND
jgi:uncharacterized membrane protein